MDLLRVQVGGSVDDWAGLLHRAGDRGAGHTRGWGWGWGSWAAVRGLGAWPAAPSCGVAQAGLSGAGQGLGAVAAPGGTAAGLMLCDRGRPARQLAPSRRVGLWAR